MYSRIYHCPLSEKYPQAPIQLEEKKIKRKAVHQTYLFCQMAVVCLQANKKRRNIFIHIRAEVTLSQKELFAAVSRGYNICLCRRYLQLRNYKLFLKLFMKPSGIVRTAAALAQIYYAPL